MTCIVGVENDNRVYIGGDSALSWFDTITSLHDAEKIFSVGPIIFGCCGSPRLAQLIRYGLKVPPHARNVDDAKYIVIDVVDAIRKLLKKKGSLFHQAEGDIDQLPWSSMLIGYRGHLYEIEDNFQITRTKDGYNAIGSGGSIALGTLYATRKHKKLSPEKRVLRALHASAHHSPFVQAPFYVLSR
jgi:ATP-dependent protease HslVU (ClpYQ) peptidase subunit